MKFLSLLQALLKDLRRRRVINVALLYAGAAWLLVQIADVGVPALFLPPIWVTAVVMLVIAGFPVVVFLAWQFEVGPDGVKRTEPGSFRGLLAISVALGLLVASTAGLTWLVIPREDASATDNANLPRLAVLPFVSLNQDPADEYLGDALPIQIINLLAKIPNLQVTARTSSFAFKGTNTSIQEIARQLGVAYVLDGSISKLGKQSQITAQLIKAEDGFNVWSDSWESDWTDLFTVQDEIAAAVVDDLQIELLGETPTVRRTDPEAYELFLRSTTASDRDDAVELVQEALNIDPKFAQGWAYLAHLQFYEGRGSGSADPVTRYVSADASANMAISLEPDNHSALFILAQISMWRDNDYVTAAKLLRKTLRRHQSAFGLVHLYGVINQNLGRVDAAIAQHRKSMQLDPKGEAGIGYLTHLLLDLGRLDEAEALIDQNECNDPRFSDHWWCRTVKGRLELGRGNPEKVLEYAADGSHPYLQTLIAMALYDLNRIEESDAVIATMQNSAGGFFAWAIALVYGYRGETALALDWLERSYQNRDEPVHQVRHAHEFRHLHGEPRWEALLDKLGLSDRYAETALDTE